VLAVDEADDALPLVGSVEADAARARPTATPAP
jgi:hypothetical protein